MLDYIHPSRSTTMVEVTIEKYVELGAAIRPQTVVIPDAFKDRQLTLSRAAQFIEAVRGQDWYGAAKNAVVPQGTTLDEYLMCATELAALMRVDVFGVPKWLVQSEQRKAAELSLGYLFPKTLQHRLGVWKGPCELFAKAAVPQLLRSWDMSMPWGFAQAGSSIDDSTQSTLKHSYYPDKLIDAKLAAHNCLTVMELIRNGQADS